MAIITAKGRELARKLAPLVNVDSDVLETCSLICRSATTHNKLAEVQCGDGSRWAESRAQWAEKRTEIVEAHIARLVATLPHTTHGPIAVWFGGDPRGYTVKLTVPVPNAREYYDDWGQDGICVPQV